MSAMRKLLIALLLLASIHSTSPLAQQQLDSLLVNGSVLLHSPRGEMLISHQPTLPLIPASLIKIPIAQVALAVLGEDYRFETHFYQNQQGDLLVRGLGDPLLVSEEIAEITAELARQGLKQVTRLIMDDSAFEPTPDLPVETGAKDPYAARNSALAVNFNTVSLAWTQDGRLVSGEAQTPLTELARQMGSQINPGPPQRINLGTDPLAGLGQAHQLFRHFLEKSGVTVTDAYLYRDAVSEDWTLLYEHSNCRSLESILQDMLRYSNNFIANQLFMTIGAHEDGYPATVEKSRRTLEQKLVNLYGEGFGQNPERLVMLEGSGLSRQQLTSAVGMMRILEVFIPQADLLAEADGMLRKSGTLTGVYNFAGYIPGADGLYPFVILTNQGVNNRDEILAFLRRQVQQ
ncbi:MAG: D-alanyl-D-alanine carboxypeptidase [Gammaproteobacteria bacterium]|nr:D-alanyl-D-alanine carboxypeptidase [Gammaproteobacteria bacterium]